MEELRETPVGEALLLEEEELLPRERGKRPAFKPLLNIDDFLDLDQEPRIDIRRFLNFLQRHADTERVTDIEDTLGTRVGNLVHDLLAVRRLAVKTVLTGLKPAQRLLEGFLERAADRHHFAHSLHLRGQAVIRLRELLKGETRHLRHDVVNRRLEGNRGLAACDVVPELVKRVTHGELCRNLCDRETRRLGSESGRTRHTRIHFDHDQAAVLRIHGELHVRTARIHADLAENRDRGVTHDLILFVGQRLGRSNGNRVTRVDAHRIEVLN
ncbi:putative uncharacterized protein [Sutterella sp. CAG:351]|nr:putative uncharacterized protein [Sutterella sp. CAG:351]